MTRNSSAPLPPPSILQTSSRSTGRRRDGASDLCRPGLVFLLLLGRSPEGECRHPDMPMLSVLHSAFWAPSSPRQSAKIPCLDHLHMTPRFGSGKRAGDKYHDSPPPVCFFFSFFCCPGRPRAQITRRAMATSVAAGTARTRRRFRWCNACGRAMRWADGSVPFVPGPGTGMADWDGRVWGPANGCPCLLGQAGSGLTASSRPRCSLRRAPRCRSRWREVDMIPGTSGRRPTNQHQPQGELSSCPCPTTLAGWAGRLGLVISTTIRFCTVYGAGARGIADSGLAGLLQPLASSSTHQASMARRGRQVANGEPFGDEAGHSSRHWTQWLGG